MRQSPAQHLALVALFTALTTIATLIQIPMPALIGTPFVHLGNALVVISVLLLGYRQGALAGALGLALADVLTGMAGKAPYYFCETLIVAGVTSIVMIVTRLRLRATMPKVIAVVMAAVLTKLLMTIGYKVVSGLLLGVSWGVAWTRMLTALPPTILNGITTVLVVCIMHSVLVKNQRFAQMFGYKNN